MTVVFVPPWYGYVVQSGRTASIDGDDGRGILRDSSADLRHRRRRWKALGSSPSVPIRAVFQCWSAVDQYDGHRSSQA